MEREWECGCAGSLRGVETRPLVGVVLGGVLRGGVTLGVVALGVGGFGVLFLLILSENCKT